MDSPDEGVPPDARRALLALGAADVLLLAALPLALGDTEELLAPKELAARLGVGLLLFLLQALFLRPVLPTRRGASPHALLPSLVVAALSTTFLVFAVPFLAFSVVRLCGGPKLDRILPDDTGWLVAAAFGVSWAVFTVLLVRWTRRRGGEPEGTLDLLAARLLRGTAVEALALIPVDVMVRRKTDCYCGEGSFFALLFWLTGGFLVAGPALFLVWTRRARRTRRRVAQG